MKIKNVVAILLLFIVAIGGKCTEKEDMNEHTEQCVHTGVVKDYTGLDGCGLIIESDGEKFEPVEIPEGKKLNAGDSISFSYKQYDGGSICMVGKMISITCLEVIKPAKPLCNAFRSIQLDSISHLPMSKYTLNSYKIQDHKLILNIRYSGCGNYKDQILYVSTAEMKSLPPQRNCILYFNSQDCEALITADVCIDLSDITHETVLLLKTEDRIERITFTP